PLRFVQHAVRLREVARELRQHGLYRRHDREVHQRNPRAGSMPCSLGRSRYARTRERAGKAGSPVVRPLRPLLAVLALLICGVAATTGPCYKVMPGDTLAAIAARFHTTPAALASANHLNNPN